LSLVRQPIISGFGALSSIWPKNDLLPFEGRVCADFDVEKWAICPINACETCTVNVTLESYLFPPIGTDLGTRIMTAWIQRECRISPLPRGFHIITSEVLEGMPELAEFTTGLLHVFIQHTSASLSINENADPDVPVDLESSLSAIAREDFPYRHTIEGPDDMPAHVKSSLLGNSVTVPVRGGRLALGTWQGIYLCEHRNAAGPRTLVMTLQGQRGG